MGFGHGWRESRINGQIEGGAQRAPDLTVQHRGVLAVCKLIANQGQAFGGATGCQRFNQLYGDLHWRDTKDERDSFVVNVIGGEGAQLIEQ